MGTHVRIIRVAITWCIETENYGIQEGQKAWEFSIALFHLERNHLFFENFMCILIILTTFPYRHQRFPEPLSFIIHLTFCVLIFSLSLPICDAQILDVQPSTGGCWGPQRLIIANSSTAGERILCPTLLSVPGIFSGYDLHRLVHALTTSMGSYAQLTCCY